MRPDTAEPGSEDGASGFDSWLALQRVTDATRANIVADLVGHPKGAPSVDELAYTNPSLEADTIRNHLKVLAEAGVVEELTVPAGQRTRGYPYKFYRVTAEARELFDRNGLFPAEAWQRQYDRVEKTTEIKELEAMPRPEE